MDAAGFEFFKVILDTLSEKMRLPPPFVELLKGHGIRELKLREVDDGHTSLWDVGVVLEDTGLMYHKRGWEPFTRCYSMRYGDFVHFSFDGDVVLTVKVFDPIMCLRHYHYSDGSESDDNGSYSSDDSDELIERGPGIRMIPSSLDEQKGKMEFGPEFTKAGLKNYLKKSVKVNVGCTANGERHNMMMKMGAGNKKAILSRGWTTTMTSYKIKKGANVIFCFQPNGPDELLLEMIVMN
ncbi:unnamed protein product [Alopecurus aequalis]